MAKTRAHPASTEQLQRMTLFAGSLMKSGVPDGQIAEQLVAQGLKPETALTIIRELRKARTVQLRRRARRDLRIGGALMILAVIGTLALLTGVIQEPTGNGLFVALLVVIIAGFLLWRAWSDQRAAADADAKPGASDTQR